MPIQMNEIGKQGLDHWSGYITQEFLTELRGKEGFKRFNEMRLNSAVVTALLTSIEQSIRSCDWNFTSDLGPDDPRLLLLEDSFDNMTYSLNDHISEVLTMLPFGFSIFELVYERVGGRILWHKLAFRGQDTVDRWVINERGGIDGFWQVTNMSFTPVFIPIEKMLLYRTRIERNNPEGRSILRGGYKSYYYAKNIEVIEAIGIERDLNGLPVITLPEGANTNENDDNSDASKAAKIVRNVRNDEQAGLVLPFGWMFQLAAAQSSRLFDTNAIIARHEKRMLMSTLAQFLALGMDGIGAFSLSTDQTDFFNMAINATADIISDTFTKFAIPRLLKLNGYDPDGVQMQHTPAGDVDLEKFTKSLQAAGSYITWTSEDEVVLRAMFGLPELTVEQIDEAKSVEREQQIDIISGFRPNPQQPQEDDTEDEDNSDQMTVDLFASGQPKDVGKRRRSESLYKNRLAKFWDGQRERILKEIGK